MSLLLRLRRHLLTPGIEETRIARRGFHEKNADSTALLETVGAHFIGGFAEATGSRTVDQLQDSLPSVPERFRGFAAEGAGMGFAVLDAIIPGPRYRVDQFLAYGEHEYMILVGVGWAMARLPRFLWPAGESFDPLLRWLALDGYGFHQAYFRTDTWVRGEKPEFRTDWAGPGTSRYSSRAVDQGIGRALWFVGGTDPEYVADLVEAYPEHRHADLWSGVGLAATYAGGGDPADLAALTARAVHHRAALAQGSAFACEARLRAGLLVPHVGRAAEVLAGRDATSGAAICRDTRPDAGDPGPGPIAYEAWRRRIGDALISSEVDR